MSEDRKIIEYDGVKYYKKRPIYGFELAKHKFVEIQPHLYDFELSKQLEQKWIRGIEEQIPTFLTTIQYGNTNAIVCELQQNYRGKKGLKMHLETSKDITKTVKEIKFENMFELRILNGRPQNIIVLYKEQYFELVNKHYPKIKFFVYIEEDEDEESDRVIIDAEIERI
uniref:Uncharacterized protein n=1 Tax=Meloidogyne floridensis TaxID=298350 RepID=A0A915NUI3_9BILA